MEAIIAERDAALVAIKELVGMLRRTGGFMCHQDQECIWRAEALVAAMPVRSPDRDLRHRILALLAKQTVPLSPTDIREHLHGPKSRAHGYNQMCIRLVAEGLLVRTGARRTFRYAIARPSDTLTACL